MSQEQNDQSELIASLLRQALEKTATSDPPEETRQELAEVLGAVGYLQSTNRQTLLSEQELQSIALEIQQEATSTRASSEETAAAEQLRLALEGQPLEANASLDEALSAASYLKNAPHALGEDFLLQLSQEVQREAKSRSSEHEATPHEERAADVLRHVLDGNTRVIASEQLQREVSAVLSTAAYLRNANAARLLSPKELAAVQDEVVKEAQLRADRKRRIAIFGGASFLALAASAIFLLGSVLNPPKREKIEAKFPEVPALTQEILPGSDPLERLDPMYEAGLRSLREARFLGAHYASPNAH